MLYHKHEDNYKIIWRIVGGKWELWSRNKERWVPFEDYVVNKVPSIFSKACGDIIVSYSNTWCEPYEGME